ncbi:MAG: hypothetical protein ACR2P6_07345 [Gammaproteobacteria bacterium]
MFFRTLLFVAALPCLAACAEKPPSSSSGHSVNGSAAPVSETERLGQAILDIQYALDNPTAPESLDAITRLGHDSRYYVMVRGWLVQELHGLQSISAGKDGSIGAHQRAKLDFLQQAIRAIDLE